MPRGVYDRKKSKARVKVKAKTKKPLNDWQKSAKLSMAIHNSIEVYPNLKVVEVALNAFTSDFVRARLYDAIVGDS